MTGNLGRLRRLTFIDALGTGAFTASAVVLLTQLVHLTTRAAGHVLALGALLSVCLLLPVGKLVDRLTVRTTMVCVNATLAVVTLVLLVSRNQVTAVALLGLLALGGRAVSVARAAALGNLIGADRVAQRARNRVAYNLGLSIGGLSAAGLVAVGTHEGLLVIVVLDAASFLVCAAVALGLDATPAATTDEPVGSFAAVRNGRFVAACAANAVGSLHNGLLFVMLPLWIESGRYLPLWFIPVITVVNTALVVGLQRRLAGNANDVRAGARLQIRAALLMAGGCAVISGGERFAETGRAVAALVAVVAWSVSEMWQSGAGWAIAYDLSPPDRLAEYQSLYQVGAGLEAVASPLLAAAIVVALPAGAGWIIVGVGCVLAVACLQLVVTKSLRTALGIRQAAT